MIDVGPGAVPIEVHDIGPPRPLGGAGSLAFSQASSLGPGDSAGIAVAVTSAALIEGARRGFVPSTDAGEPDLWCSPDPRAVIVPSRLHVSRRLARTIRQGRFYVSLDAAFERVLAACADRPDTWLTMAHRRAYARLHRLGWAHSFEAWTVGGELAGGLFGLQVGGLFAAGSMFHAVPDAAKVAFVAMIRHCHGVGVTLVDVQRGAPFLSAMGAIEVPRMEYVDWVRGLADRQVAFSGPCGGPDDSLFETWAFVNTSM